MFTFPCKMQLLCCFCHNSRKVVFWNAIILANTVHCLFWLHLTMMNSDSIDHDHDGMSTYTSSTLSSTTVRSFGRFGSNFMSVHVFNWMVGIEKTNNNNNNSINLTILIYPLLICELYFKLQARAFQNTSHSFYDKCFWRVVQVN